MAGNAVAMEAERDLSRSSMVSEVLQQRPSRTLAPITSKPSGLGPINIKPLPKPLTTSLRSPPVSSVVKPTNGEHTSSDESSSNGSDSESDSDSDKLPPTPSVPAGKAVPPPLRNIPHQTPDTSPQATRVLSQPLVPRPSVTLQPILRPIVSHQGMKRPPLNLSTLQSRGTPPSLQAKPHASITSVAPFDSAKFTDQQTESGSPQLSNVESQSQNDIPLLPRHTSTPKSKQSLCHDRAADSRSQDGEVSSVGQKESQKSSETSDNQFTESVDTKVAKLQAPEICISSGSVEAKPVSQQISLANTVSDSKPPLAPRIPSKRKSRTPSKVLQRSLSQQSSSSTSDLSDDSTLSDDSNQSEGRDRFDPVMHQRNKLLMVPRVGSFTGQPTLPPLPGVGRQPIPRIQSLPRPAFKPSIPLPPIPSPDSHDQPSFYSAPPTNDAMQPPSYYASQATASSANPMIPQGATSLPQQYSGSESTDGHSVSHNAYGIGMEGGMFQDLSQEEIHLSAMEGTCVSEMKTLALQYGVDYRDSGGRTPLMYAVLGNQPKMCETLIKLKATVNMVDQGGVTPLLWATFHAKPDIMRILLKNGASVRTTDPDDRTAFHWAMRTPNIHCLKWLCKYASVPEAINQPDKDNLSPLHWAVMSDQATHVKMLLNTDKVNLNMQDTDGRAALNYAVLNFSPSCIRAILDYNEAAVRLIDMKGRTALHYACAEGSADCVRTLLTYKSCNLHAVDHNGTTPLHWAAAADQPGLVQLLLRRGADRGQRDNNDNTPLDYAQQRNHLDCVKILRSYGLRRPGSAMSLLSHASINAAIDPPTLDEHGHVVFKTAGRRFSFSRRESSVSSLDRLPADGQAQQSESDGQRAEQNGVTSSMDEGRPEEMLESTGNVGGPNTRMVASISQENLLHQSRRASNESNNQVRTSHKGWMEILFCGCCASCKHNRVAPA